MMKFVLLSALVAMVLAGPSCTTLENASFDDENTVVPWLTTPYNLGSSYCRNWVGNPETCELIQQQAFAGKQNSGRISVGSNERAGCRNMDGLPQGTNVYQQNIGLCEGSKVSALIGTSDRRNSGGQTNRVPVYFALVVGDDLYDLNGGNRAVLPGSEFTFPVATDDFNALYSTTVSGVWTSACGSACPDTSCHAVGVRSARNERVTINVRSYLDDLMIEDITPPTVTFNGQTMTADACDGSATFTLDASGTDNCCSDVTISYTLDSSAITSPVTLSVGCHDIVATGTDTAGLTSTMTATFCVENPPASITCQDGPVNAVQECWNDVPAYNYVTNEDHCGDHSVMYTSGGSAPTTDVTSFNFRLGETTMQACITSDTGGAGGTNTDCCTFVVSFNLCCEWTIEEKKRATPVVKLAKF